MHASFLCGYTMADPKSSTKPKPKPEAEAEIQADPEPLPEAAAAASDEAVDEEEDDIDIDGSFDGAMFDPMHQLTQLLVTESGTPIVDVLQGVLDALDKHNKILYKLVSVLDAKLG